MSKKTVVGYGCVLPHYGRYGISGWDCIVKGFEAVFQPTKKAAMKWMKDHGFDVLS